MDRLTCRDEYGFAYIRGTDVIDMEERNDEAIEKLADYEDAEEQGRLFTFPFAIGDTVYEVCNSYGNRNVTEQTVHGYLIGSDTVYIVVGNGGSLNAKNIGRTVFCTRDEAEAKLKELEGEQ